MQQLEVSRWPAFCVCVLVTQACHTLCNPRDCSLPGSSVHGILQARALEWVAISYSRGSSPHRDQTQVSFITGRFFTIWATREDQNSPIFEMHLKGHVCFLDATFWEVQKSWPISRRKWCKSGERVLYLMEVSIPSSVQNLRSLKRKSLILSESHFT